MASVTFAVTVFAVGIFHLIWWTFFTSERAGKQIVDKLPGTPRFSLFLVMFVLAYPMYRGARSLLGVNGSVASLPVVRVLEIWAMVMFLAVIITFFLAHFRALTPSRS